MEIRALKDADWEEILAVANAAVAHVPNAGPQDEWLRNRMAGGPGADQHHFVCMDGGELVGYGAAESSREALDQYRLFVVTAPERFGTVGEFMFAELARYLERVGATRSWFLEYLEDDTFTRFLERHGYEESDRFEIGGGVEVVRRARERGTG